MEEYISREALIEELKSRDFYPAIVRRAIEAIPAADVRPVVQGKWTLNRDGSGTFNRGLRFLNYKRRADEQEKAGIILFYGVSAHGEDIPVDSEVIQNMLSFFQNRLKQREEEFRILGSGGSNG